MFPNKTNYMKCNLILFYTDNWGSYKRNLPLNNHEISKKNTQTIERNNLTLRTRIKRLTRKSICFSKTSEMHDIIIWMGH